MNNIKKLRKKNNLTLDELGNAIEIGKPSISRYENGSRTPKPEVWDKLANFFGVSVEYLQGAYSKEEVIEIAEEAGYSDEQIQIFVEDWFNIAPLKWLFEKPELNASRKDVEQLLLACYQPFYC